MFTRRSALLAAMAFVLLAGSAVTIHAESGDSTAFERIKALKGDWVGKMPDGSTSVTTFRTTAAGSVVMQMIGEGTEMEMPTMYHMDGDRLIVTHYCAAKNQPRMVLESGQDPEKSLKFKFLDATNLKSPDDGHMNSVAFQFIDQDHIRQEWTFREKDKETTEVFDLVRKR